MLRPITVAMTTNSVRTAAFSISMYACDRPDGKDARLLGVKYTPYWPNNRHDAYIDTIPHARLYLRFQSLPRYYPFVTPVSQINSKSSQVFPIPG